MRERRRLLWGSPFFGLTEEYKLKLHELIFDLCYFGKIEYDAIYSMPIQYRTFYVHKLINIKEKEKGQYNSSAGDNDMSPKQKIVRGPSIQR